MAIFTPAPETVKEWLAAGLWVDVDDQLHFDAEAFCIGNDILPTEENQRHVERYLMERFPQLPYTELFDK